MRVARLVEAEQAGEPVGVLLRLLQVVDQGQLALDERLAAARKVDEHRVQVAAQHGFVGRQPNRFPVYLVEGPRHFTISSVEVTPIGSISAEASPPSLSLSLRTIAGSLLPATLKGVGAQLAQRADHGPRHEGRDEQDEISRSSVATETMTALCSALVSSELACAVMEPTSPLLTRRICPTGRSACSASMLPGPAAGGRRAGLRAADDQRLARVAVATASVSALSRLVDPADPRRCSL